MLKQLNKPLKFGTILIVSIFLTLAFSVSLQSLFAAWTAPSSNPPTNNVADLNLGGGLSVAKNTLVMGNFAASNTKMALFADTTTGNVGIGTTTPSAKLDVSGMIKSTTVGGLGTNLLLVKNSGAAITFSDEIKENALIQARATNNNLEFFTNTNTNSGIIQRMTINNSGNVGIGISTPTQKLDVNGNIRVTGQFYGNGAASFYGALSVDGAKNNWSGINFRSGSTNYGTLMMHPSYSGFFNSTDNGWRWYVNNSGNSYQPGKVTASDVCTTAGKCLNAVGGGLSGYYRCPLTAGCDNGTPISGVWVSLGCVGQISQYSYCVQYWWNNGARSCYNACTAL